MIRSFVVAGFAAVLFSSSAFAQAAAPAPANAPAMSAPAAKGASTAGMDKQAKSKECSAEADKQGLHGKARKTFRSKCKAGKA